jgi:hypothetical protein
VLIVGGLVTVAITAFSGESTKLGEIAARVGGLICTISNFRVRRILLDHFQRRGERREVSGIGTLFLGPLFLQTKINDFADEPQPEDGAGLAWGARRDPS